MWLCRRLPRTCIQASCPIQQASCRLHIHDDSPSEVQALMTEREMPAAAMQVHRRTVWSAWPTTKFEDSEKLLCQIALLRDICAVFGLGALGSEGVQQQVMAKLQLRNVPLQAVVISATTACPSA